MNKQGVIFGLIIFLGFNLSLKEMLVNQKSFEKNAKVYADIDAFRKRIKDVPEGIIQEKTVDLNNDGKPDYLFFVTGGEEIYLYILLAHDRNYIFVEVPDAEEYELMRSVDGRYALRTGHAPVPGFGNDMFGDFLWYDHYEFDAHSMFKANERYPKVFNKMIYLYKTRIEEIEKYLLSNQYDNRFWGKPSIYRKFIEDAKKIVSLGKSDYSELSRSPEESKEIIERFYPNYRMLDMADLDPVVQTFYEKHNLSPNPFLVEKDFNGDSLFDYAFLIKNNMVNRQIAKFVIMIQRTEGLFDIAYESEYDLTNNDLFISPISPWRFFWSDRHLMNSSVGLCNYKKREGKVFWWDEDKASIDFKNDKYFSFISCCKPDLYM